MSFVQIFSLCCGIICIILSLINIFLIVINAKRYSKFNKRLYFNHLVITYRVDLLLLDQCNDVESYNYNQNVIHKDNYSFFNNNYFPLTEDQFNFLKEYIK